MGGLQPWHWLIVLVFLAVLAVGVIAVVLAITGTKKTRPVQGGGGPVPGWYPDPKDPTAMRYFDGRNWVTNSRPPGS